MRIIYPDSMFQPASSGSQNAFLAICGAIMTSFLVSIWRGSPPAPRAKAARTLPAALALLVWLTAVGILVSNGWVEAKRGHLLIFGAANMIGCSAVALSPVGSWIIKGSSIPSLLAFQVFRFPLELVLHAWARQGVIPEAMTWTGSNWDILSGLAALILAPASRRWPTAAWAGNIFGFLLLLNVARVAARSALDLGNSPSRSTLQLPFHLPYAYIVPLCVGGALAGHILLTRALVGQSSMSKDSHVVPTP